MASFGYEALNSVGKSIKGSVEADNIEQARQELKRQGLTVIDLKQQGLRIRILIFKLAVTQSPEI